MIKGVIRMPKIYTIFVILLLGQPGLLFAGETPDANDGGGVLPTAVLSMRSGD